VGIFPKFVDHGPLFTCRVCEAPAKIPREKCHNTKPEDIEYSCEHREGVYANLAMHVSGAGGVNNDLGFVDQSIDRLKHGVRAFKNRVEVNLSHMLGRSIRWQ
jgi:hypothetical protein